MNAALDGVSLVDSTPQRLRWGVAGTGTISQQVASDLLRVPEAEVLAVSSRNMESAVDFADRLGIARRHEGFAGLLRDEIDAIYLGTPHVTHFEMAKQAMEQGRHVLCEKPIATDAAEVRELAAIARANDVFLMEAMWMKFSPLHRRLLELVRGGSIGELRSVRASFGAPFPRDDSSRWKAEMRGSTLLDQGIYPVTFAHMLLGAPVTITAAGTVRDDGVDLREHFTLEYPDGVFAHGSSSMVEFLDMAASVNGTTGWITLDPGFWFTTSMDLHTTTTDGMAKETVEVDREGYGYTPMLSEVTCAILNGQREHPWHPLDDSATVFDILDAIRALIN